MYLISLLSLALAVSAHSGNRQDFTAAVNASQAGDLQVLTACKPFAKLPKVQEFDSALASFVEATNTARREIKSFTVICADYVHGNAKQISSIAEQQKIPAADAERAQQKGKSVLALAAPLKQNLVRLGDAACGKQLDEGVADVNQYMPETNSMMANSCK